MLLCKTLEAVSIWETTWVWEEENGVNYRGMNHAKHGEIIFDRMSD